MKQLDVLLHLKKGLKRNRFKITKCVSKRSMNKEKVRRKEAKIRNRFFKVKIALFNRVQIRKIR